jgi:hypothetical protein
MADSELSKREEEKSVPSCAGCQADEQRRKKKRICKDNVNWRIVATYEEKDSISS